MNDRPGPPPEELPYWCNFCGYRTEDPQKYLAHSCAEILAAAGHSPEGPGTERHCR